MRFAECADCRIRQPFFNGELGSVSHHFESKEVRVMITASDKPGSSSPMSIASIRVHNARIIGRRDEGLFSNG